MSEIESQTNDLNQFQAHLERIFKDLEDGIFITQDEIADLRYACGLPAKRNNHVNPVLRDIVNDFSNIFGANK
jgi:endonuclease III